MLSETPIVGDLVHKAEPRPDIRNVLGFREFADGIQVFGERLHQGRGDLEAGQLHFLLAELELVRVKDDAGVTGELQVLDRSQPVRLHVVVVVDGVVDAALFAHEV